MAPEDLVIFDTCTLPEYYDDVHKILSLPRGHIVTYDYSAQHIQREAVAVLKECVISQKPRRVLLAYMQAKDYKKGDPSSDDQPLPEGSFVMLTRLAELVTVREITNNNKVRYYLDLRLGGYPFDRRQAVATDIAVELRKHNSIPMQTYIAVCPDNASNVLFAQTQTDEQGYSSVVDGLSTLPSQFHLDTFWRIYKISSRTKSLIPFLSSKTKELQPLSRFDGERTLSYLSVPDQSTIYFYVQFHRGREHGSDYRIRKFKVEISPKAGGDEVAAAFATRSFGRETVAINVPATSSLSIQDIRYQFETLHHDADERKDFPYGPSPAIPVTYRKALIRSVLAIALICFASALFSWAAFSTSVASGTASSDATVSVCSRTIAIVIGVLASLYSYYLWNDEINLDRARHS
jgi:hypothetical protein